MKRLSLAALLLLLMLSLTLGWDLSLATGLSVKNAFLYMIMLALFVEAAAFHNRSLDLPSVVLPFTMLVAYATASWLIMIFVVQWSAYDPFVSAIALKTELMDHYIAFMIFFFGLASARDSLALIRFIVWMTMIGNLIAVVDAFDVPDLGIIHQREDGRVSGPIGESNAYGAFIALTLPASVALAIESRGSTRQLAIAGTFVTVVALFLTSSRGAFVGLAAGCLFSLVFLRAYLSLRLVAYGALCVFAFIILALILLYATGYLGLIEERFIRQTSGNAFEATSSRSAIWTLAILRIAEHPYSLLTGFGWDAYDHMRGLFPRSMHNFYLNKLFNLGLPGLILVLVLFRNIVVALRQALPFTSGAARTHIMGCIFGAASLGAAIFFIDLHAPWIFIWAYVGLVLRLAVESSKAAYSEARAAPHADPVVIPFSQGARGARS